MHWRYCSLALSHRDIHASFWPGTLRFVICAQFRSRLWSYSAARSSASRPMAITSTLAGPSALGGYWPWYLWFQYPSWPSWHCERRRGHRGRWVIRGGMGIYQGNFVKYLKYRKKGPWRGERWTKGRESGVNGQNQNICLTYWDMSKHYGDIIMSAMASQITSLTIVYSIVYSRADQRKHQSSASQAFVRGIHRWPVNSPHKGQ